MQTKPPSVKQSAISAQIKKDLSKVSNLLSQSIADLKKRTSKIEALAKKEAAADKILAKAIKDMGAKKTLKSRG